MMNKNQDYCGTWELHVAAAFSMAVHLHHRLMDAKVLGTNAKRWEREKKS